MVFVFPQIPLEISFMINDFVQSQLHYETMSVPVIKYQDLYLTLHTEYKKDFEETFIITENATIQ